MGFGSDVELLFVFDSKAPEQDRPLLNRFVEELDAMVERRSEGIFQLDFRLRPYGKAGALAVSLGAFKRYYEEGGNAWPYERQGLVRLRPLAGDAALAKSVIALRDQILYSKDSSNQEALKAIREKQIRSLVSPGRINAKYSRGGLVDIEYLVQTLQLQHGHLHPDLRTTNTLEAIQALETHGVLSPKRAAALEEGYSFFRQLIDSLRIARGHAKDLTVPLPGSPSFRFLERRLGTDELEQQLERHLKLAAGR